MEDLTKARVLSPEEIEAMRERFREAECLIDETIAKKMHSTSTKMVRRRICLGTPLKTQC